MSRSQLKQKSPARRRKPGVEALVENVVRQLAPPERVFELYYWSREPELLEVIRAVAAMPPASQAALGAFLAMADNGESATASIDGAGNLVLRSPDIAEALAEVIDARETHIEVAPAAAPRIH